MPAHGYPRDCSAGEARRGPLAAYSSGRGSSLPTSWNSSGLERNCVCAGYSVQPNPPPPPPPRDWEVGGAAGMARTARKPPSKLQDKLLGLPGEARLGAESELLICLCATERGQSIHTNERQPGLDPNQRSVNNCPSRRYFKQLHQ